MKGEVDAGAAYDGSRAAVARSYPDVFNKIKVLAYTKDIPNDTVTARKGLPLALKKRIKEGLKFIARTRKEKKY